MAEEIEIIDSPIDTEVATETAETSAVDVNALIEQNKKLYARAKTAEAKLKDKPAEQIINNPSLKPIDILRDDAFKLYRMGHDEKEIDIIMNNGGIKILDDTDNPITLGIKARKEQRKAEDASNRLSDSSQQTDVLRKYTPEQLKAMSQEELKKILPHAD